MAVSVAEYLGVEVNGPVPIQPALGISKCPFMDANCSKINAKLKPVCSVKKTDGDTWIVCKHRLCSTIKSVALTLHQKKTLISIAKRIWGQDLSPEQIFVKREVRMPLTEKSGYNADYVMVNTSDKVHAGSKKVVLEMQGGGETSNTGFITRHITEWENNPNRTNEQLGMVIKEAGTIETNAWRRQQEQFLIKGNIAHQTGGAIVFCVGKSLYDYLYQRIPSVSRNNLEQNNWTLCLIGFSPDENIAGLTSINFTIDNSRVLFTNYTTFVQALTNQGKAFPGLFKGEFDSLGNAGRVTL